MLSEDHNDYIKMAMKYFDDVKIGKMLGVTAKTIYNRRARLGLLRKSGVKDQAEIDTQKIALIIEWFANGMSIETCASKFKLPTAHVSLLIKLHFKTLKKSKNTITLLIESKLNFD